MASNGYQVSDSEWLHWESCADLSFVHGTYFRNSVFEEALVKEGFTVVVDTCLKIARGRGGYHPNKL